MTLSSSTSRQHRKSMLPTPRLSSRMSSRRIALSDTSRIARRVPSPLSASRCENVSIAHAHVPQPAELGTRRAASPSRIPGPSSGWTSCSIPEQGDASSSLTSTPRPEVVKRTADAQYPTPPSSAEPKDGKHVIKVQEGLGRVFPAPVQHQESGPRNSGPVAPPGRVQIQHAVARRPASTAFTAAGFSRIENTLHRDGAAAADTLPTLARKKLARTSSVSGKENRRPQIRTRVPAPPVASALASAPAPAPVALATATSASVPQPRPIRRTVAVVAPPSQASFRGTLPRPLVIKKQPSRSLAEAGSLLGDSRVKSVAAAGAAAVAGVTAGIKALMEDVDGFAKEWTEMFDELSSVGANCPGSGFQRLDSSTRIYPTGQSKDAPSASAAHVSTLQASTLDSINEETIHLDAILASLGRRQRRNNAMTKDPPVEDDPERDLPALVSDPPCGGGQHNPEKAVLRNASTPITPQASRHYLPLPEINQSPIISGSHLVEMTSVGSLNRKDGLTKLPESHPTTPRSTDIVRRNGITHNARYYPPATLPSVSFSPLSTITSLSSASSPYSIPPWVNLQGNEFSPQRSLRAASDSVPTRSSSLRGLRAIFKRTSAGLTGGQRQRAESLKGLISEPRILSLGSISISNLRDAGVSGGCRQEESEATTGELARKTTVKW